MKLERLTLHRMPGISRPFSIEPEGEINLVVGPNGSGKTTLCRAVRALVWPAAESPDPLALESRWRRGERLLRADREGHGPTRWHDADGPCQPPSLPGHHLARCYTLGLPQLFRETLSDADRTITRAILRQLSGGFDLDETEDRLFTVGEQIGRKEARRITELEKAFRLLQAERAALAAREDELGELRRRHAEAKRAGARCVRLAQQQRVSEAARRVAAAKAGLQRFANSAISRLDGKEEDTLADLEARATRNRAALADCVEAIERARRTIEEVDLPSAGVPAERLAAARARARAMAELERDHGQQALRVSAAAAALASAANNIAADPDALPELDEATLDEAERLLGREAACRAQLDANARLLQLRPLESETEDVDVGDHERGLEALETWLAAGWNGRTKPLIGLAATGLLLVVAGGAWVALTIHWSGAVLAGVAFATAVAVLGSALAARRRADEARAAFPADSLETPGRWDAAAVRNRLRELRDGLVRTRRDEVRHAIRDGLEADRDQRRAELKVELPAERDAMQRRVGAAPGASALTLIEFARHAHAYQAARTEHEASTEAQEAAARQLATARETVNQLLIAFGAEPAIDAAQAQAAVDALDERNRRFFDARASRHEKQTQRDRLEEEGAHIAARRDELFRDLELDPGDVSGLRRLLEDRPDYRAAQREHDDALAELKLRAQDVAQGPVLEELAGFEAWTEDRLAERIAAEQERANKAEPLAERIARIDQQVSDACASTAVEQARASVDAARYALHERREEALDAAAGSFLVERIRRDHEARSRPAVEARASELFACFTDSAFTLQVRRDQDGRAVFRALETATETWKELDQLSDGTRAQLFLAARLAFAFESERAVRPPLFLDEALSNSDPVRFDAVVRSLALLVRNDSRQVFYLTSNPGDVALWNRTLADLGMPAVKPIDLAAVRGLAAAAAPERLDPPALPSVPPPEEMTAAAYGRRIGVPAIEPADDMARVPIFYLLTDYLPLLFDLLTARIETIGAWRRLRATVVHAKVVGEEDARRLDVKCEAVAAFLSALRIGRPLPVTRELLEATDAITDNFIDRVAEIAREHEGDGAQLLAALEDGTAKGFRKRNLDPLRDHLEEHGCVDDRPRLDETEVRARVLDATAAHLAQHRVTVAEIIDLVHTLWTAASHGVRTESPK